MSPRELKIVIATVALMLSALGVQWFVLPSTDQMLRAARSEVRVPTVVATTRPTTPAVGPETRHSGTEVAKADRRPRAETQPVVVTAGAPQKPRPESSTLIASMLRTIFGTARSGETRATNTATASSGQAAIPIEAFGASVVGNDPVTPTSGEMTYSHPIVRVPGVGLDFAFVLTYRSGFTYDGPVGNQWEHNWNARFHLSDPDGDAIRYANNRVDTYATDGVGGWTPPTGSFEKSVVGSTDGDGHSTIERRLRDGTLEVYTELDSTNFPGWYFLARVQHRDSDNALTLDYDGGEKLTKINDTRGKYFKLTYDGNQRVSNIEDHSAGSGSSDRTWTLAYTSGNLTSITTPSVGGAARVTEFSYVSSTSYLSGVKAPREQAASGDTYLDLAYDGSSHRVTSQKFGVNTQTYTLSYDTGAHRTTETNREGVKRIYHYDGTTSAITKISQEVTSGVYDDTLFAWNGDALLTKITYPEGNGQLFQYANGQMTAAIQSNSSGLSETSISTMRSGSNHLVTEYSYQTATNWELVTKIKDPIGNEWALERDSLGNVTSYKTPAHTGNPWTMAYDSRSRVTRIEDPETRARKLEYGANGTLTKTTLDPDGGGLALATTLARDKYDNVTSITDAEGYVTAIARNELNFVTSVTSPEGRVTDYLYDKNDLVTEVHRDYGSADYTNSEAKTVYTYNILDIVTQVQEFYGASYASHRDWTYAYDKEDRQTLTTLPEMNQIKVFYDYKGNRTTVRKALGTGAEKDDTFAYDKNNRLTLALDGIANSTTRAFDQFDRATKATDPEGHYRTTDYDKNSNVTTMRGYNSANTKLTEMLFEFDLNNRMTKRREWAKKADLSTDLITGSYIDSTLAYDKAGLLTQKSDPCGCGGSTSTTYAFDKASRKTKITDAANNDVTYAFDKNGLTTKITRDETEASITKAYVVEYKYDDDRYLTEIDQKGGGSDTAHTITYQVDGFGRATKVIDANSQETQLKRDDFGRVTKRLRVMSVTPTYIETRTEYDKNDNVVTRTLERGATDSFSVYVYDAADRMVTMKDEGGTISRVLYDDADNVITSYDRNTTQATYTYDKRNLVTEIDFSLATGVSGPTQEKFWYDGAGRTTKAYNQDGLVTRTWNTLSRIETETTWVMPSDDSGTGTTSRNIEYIYDGSGRATEVKYPDTSSDSTRLWVRYSFDSLNRTTKIEKKAGSGGSYGDVATWVFQGPGRMKTLELGNTTKETLTYDQYGRATGLVWDRPISGGRTSIFEFTRGYDLGDRPTYERRDYWKNSTTTILGGSKDYGDRYYYDQADRLTKVIKGVGSASSHDHALVSSAGESTTDYFIRTRYDLDVGGNRQTLHYDLPIGNDLRREDGEFDLENQLTLRKIYDWNGSTLTQTGGNITPSYDANGNQTGSPTVKVDVHNRIYEFGYWRYRYDPFGRRIEKHDTNTGGQWLRMYYDGVRCINEHVTTQTGGAAPVENALSFYLRVFGPYLVDQLLWARETLCEDCPIEGYMHGDFLGTVVATSLPLSGGVATVPETYRYDEYGQPYFFDGDGNAMTASLGAQSYLFTGREWDSELGFYYYRARYYRQDLGVFAERDPFESDTLGGAYSYVTDRPVELVDPLGLQAGGPKDHKPLPGADAVGENKSACQPECGQLRCPDGLPPRARCCESIRNSCGAAVGKANETLNETAKSLSRSLEQRWVQNDMGTALYAGFLYTYGLVETLAGGYVIVQTAGVGTVLGGGVMVADGLRNTLEGGRLMYGHFEGPSEDTKASVAAAWSAAQSAHDAAVALAVTRYMQNVMRECCNRYPKTHHMYDPPSEVGKDPFGETAYIAPSRGSPTAAVLFPVRNRGHFKCRARQHDSLDHWDP